MTPKSLTLLAIVTLFWLENPAHGVQVSDKTNHTAVEQNPGSVVPGHRRPVGAANQASRAATVEIGKPLRTVVDAAAETDP